MNIKRRVSRNKSGFDYATYFHQMRTLNDLIELPQERTWRAVPPTDTEPHEVVLYLGCNVLQTPHMIRTMTDVLDLLRVDYVAVGGPAYCCGIVHDRHGDTELSQTIAKNAIRYLERFEPKRVVMWCPSCIFYYDEVFQVPASFEILHATEFLAEHLNGMDFVRHVPGRVGLHYHCDSPRRQREARAAERLLAAIPGLDYLEIDSDVRLERICSAAAQQSVGLEVWAEIVERQLQQAEEKNAGIFATLYHGCQRLICGYEKSSLRIEHYLSTFARALGIEHEDTYKKYRLWEDPERVLAAMTPCMSANTVKGDTARRLAHVAFPD